MYTTVYGKSFDEMLPSDFLIVNETLDVIDGSNGKYDLSLICLFTFPSRPNMATRFHLHVYRKRPDIQCLIHTHPPYTSALGQLGVPLHISHMGTCFPYINFA